MLNLSILFWIGSVQFGQEFITPYPVVFPLLFIVTEEKRLLDFELSFQVINVLPYEILC